MVLRGDKLGGITLKPGSIHTTLGHNHHGRAMCELVTQSSPRNKVTKIYHQTGTAMRIHLSQQGDMPVSSTVAVVSISW